ncbi:MAG: prenyltransferase [Planctomycetota bacterium]|nr:MAG: prenyltransferase [Planctomycetota bacterium]
MNPLVEEQPQIAPVTVPPSSPPTPDRTATSIWSTIVPYISIARPDHWCKNVFMALGVVLAYFYEPTLWGPHSLAMIALGVLATCLVASSNYVINELLDAKHDRHHPVKCQRPIPSGRVRESWAYAEWIGLGVVGLGLSWIVGPPFFATAALLLFMGLIYNIPPIRTKELPYVDVLSESVNNPIRLGLGWFAAGQTAVPPLSLLIAYWMVGAFFMGAKRFSEYRSIGDPAVAAAYRSSFRHYDESKLLVSLFFYATATALFLGIFIVRHHMELILCVPLMAGFFSYYLHVALKHESAAQAPERLYKERGLMIYLVICLLAFVACMFVSIPALYEWFGAEPSRVTPLWKL